VCALPHLLPLTADVYPRVVAAFLVSVVVTAHVFFSLSLWLFIAVTPVRAAGQMCWFWLMVKSLLYIIALTSEGWLAVNGLGFG